MTDAELIDALYQDPCPLSLEDMERAGRLTMAAMDRHDAPHLAQLRAICQAIGYGRVIQQTQAWWAEVDPRMAGVSKT